MRLILAGAVLALLSVSAVAQSGLSGLAGGQVATAIGSTKFGGSCYVGRGFSTFERSYAGGIAGSKAVISFSELFDSGKYDLAGQAVMTFANGAAGDIHFKQALSPGTIPTDVLDPQFTKYSESLSGLTLIVKFSIEFPDCTLPVTAVFDGT